MMWISYHFEISLSKRNMSVKLSASILSCDFSNLRSEVEKVSKAGVDFIHFDIMDGHFVPNITMGPQVIRSLRPHTKLLFDTHLMISNPDAYIKTFDEAGSDYITVHLEAAVHIDRTIQLIHSCGKKAGVSIVPSTHESALSYILDKVDLVLIMTVNPGFGGQKFIESQLQKISKIRNMINGHKKRDIILSVDGGVSYDNAKQIIDDGVDLLVSGAAIFKAEDCAKAVKILKTGIHD